MVIIDNKKTEWTNLWSLLSTQIWNYKKYPTTSNAPPPNNSPSPATTSASLSPTQNLNNLNLVSVLSLFNKKIHNKNLLKLTTLPLNWKCSNNIHLLFTLENQNINQVMSNHQPNYQIHRNWITFEMVFLRGRKKQDNNNFSNYY